MSLVVLVPAGTQNVVPRGGLVTLEALVDSGVRLAGNTRRNHLEMHHVVTRWRLMTLGTIFGGRRGMLELGYCPAVGCMALRAILTEQLEMAIVVRVASGTVQHCLVDADIFVWRDATIGPGSQLCSDRLVFGVDGILFELSHTDIDERLVIHVCRPLGQSLVFQVALGATADTCVERCRLSLQ